MQGSGVPNPYLAALRANVDLARGRLRANGDVLVRVPVVDAAPRQETSSGGLPGSSQTILNPYDPFARYEPQSLQHPAYLPGMELPPSTPVARWPSANVTPPAYNVISQGYAPVPGSSVRSLVAQYLAQRGLLTRSSPTTRQNARPSRSPWTRAGPSPSFGSAAEPTVFPSRHPSAQTILHSPSRNFVSPDATMNAQTPQLASFARSAQTMAASDEYVTQRSHVLLTVRSQD